MAKGTSKSFRIDDLLYHKTNNDSFAHENGRRSPGRSENSKSVSLGKEHRHEVQRSQLNGSGHEVAHKNNGHVIMSHTKSVPVRNEKMGVKDMKIPSSSSPIKPVPILNRASVSQVRHLTPTYQTSQPQPSSLGKVVAPERFLHPYSLPFYDSSFHSNPNYNNVSQPNAIFPNGIATSGHHVSSIGTLPYGSSSHHGNSSLAPSNTFAHHQHHQHDHRSHSHHSTAPHPAIHQLQHPMHPVMWNHPMLAHPPLHMDCRNPEGAALFLNLHHNRLASYGVSYPNGRPGNPMVNVTNKRKGGQIRFSNSQTAQLEKSFAEHKYLNAGDRKKLANSLGLSDRQVKTWFQNRRAKWRKSRQGNSCDSETQVSGSSYSKQDQDYSPDDGGRCDSPNSVETQDSSC